MAATFGRLTGKTGVCIATLGPGATNFVTCSAYAQLGGMPMMMITGQKPIKKSKQGKFQIIDVVEMMRPITKFTKQIVNGNNIPSLVRESFRLAEEERCGAVHLELPEDIAAEEGEDVVYPRHTVRRPSPDQKAVTKAAQMIEDAKSPILLIGAAGNRNRTQYALKMLVDKLGMPFFTTQMGKGVIDERHPLCLGTASLSEGDYLHSAIRKADLFINIGHDVIEKPPFFMEPDGAKVIHVNNFTAQVDDVYFPQCEVIGDIAMSVSRMVEAVEKQNHWDFSHFMKVKERVEESIKEGADAPEFPIKPQRFVADLRKVMPDNGIIALDNGVYKIWFSRNYKAYEPNTVLLDNALATMGAGLPSAMAAAMIHPDRKVVAICGDGGFMMNSQEMETAVRLKLNLVVLILKDDSYGMIKWKQTGMGFDQWGLDFGNPDFVKYAESYGAKGHRIESTEQYAETMKACMDEGGVHLVELPVDYSENEKVLINELREKSGELG